MDVDTQQRCHELLLRLAGRLPDEHLWRFRDWNAAGSVQALARMLPLTLLRERVGITAAESRMLSAAFGATGVDAGRLTAIPWVDEIDDLGYTFTPESPDRATLGDPVAVVLTAVLHGRSDVISAGMCWRAPRSGRSESQRLVLITASGRHAELTGELQRVLRALGGRAPSVEVVAPGADLTAYHRAAADAAEPLLVGATPVAS
jgi:hypothetical protein